MEFSKFAEVLADLFCDADPSEFTPDKKFRDFSEWNSLMAVSFVVALNDEFGVTIKGNDVENSETLGDLFNVAKSKTE